MRAWLPGAISLTALLLAQAGYSDPFLSGLPETPSLTRRVTVEAAGVPVEDLLSLLRARTGVPVSAERDLADAKVILFGPPRPLRDVLTDLAALLNARWEIRKAKDESERYALSWSRKAREYEEGLLASMQERIVARLEEQVATYLQPPGEQAAQDERLRRRLSDPQARFAARLYSLLSPVQRNALFTHGRLSIPFGFLPGREQAAARQVFNHVIAGEEEIAEEERKAGFEEPVSKPDDLEKTGLRFELRHYGITSDLSLAVGRSTIRFGVAGQARWLLPAHGDPYAGTPLPANAALPPLPAIQGAGKLAAWPDRLRELAKRSGLSVCADYYRSKPATTSLPPLDAAAPGPGGGTPANAEPEAVAALDSLCRRDAYLWWTRGRSLLLRKRDWYYQRLFEVPDRWMLATAARLHAQKGVPAYGDALGLLALSREQVAGLASIGEPQGAVHPWLHFHEFLPIIRAGAPGARVPLPNLRTLPAEQLKRTRLRYAELNPLQQALVVQFLQVYPYPVAPDEARRFRGRLIYNPEPILRSPGYLEQMKARGLTLDLNYRTAAIQIGYSLEGEGRTYFNEIQLPLSLPDDRRAQTRVEIAEED